MKTTRKRGRPRGKSKIPVNICLTPSARGTAMQAAHRLNLSLSQFIESLIISRKEVA
ncbi:hypothetical protein [Geminisphaera colitermitum]|uniref:hypothetical protein n=1 Tax=Geminisphaera colitermitum TaxID=1148786 RepID=UPI00019654CA|nr:hypothetical protein [Geminisphaera colitermitum]